jgi:hypothetical protein
MLRSGQRDRFNRAMAAAPMDAVRTGAEPERAAPDRVVAARTCDFFRRHLEVADTLSPVRAIRDCPPHGDDSPSPNP